MKYFNQIRHFPLHQYPFVVPAVVAELSVRLNFMTIVPPQCQRDGKF